MNAKQVTGLMEAYNSIYTPQELNEVELWVNSLLEEGYDLSEYTWDEMYDTYLVTEFNTIVDGLLEEGYDLSQYTEQELFDALISEGILDGAVKIASNLVPKSLNVTKVGSLVKPGALAVIKPTTTSITKVGSPTATALTAPQGSTNLNAPRGPGGNNNGKKLGMLGLGAIGLGALTSTLMGRGGGGNVKVDTMPGGRMIPPIIPVDAGSKRRKEQLVGQKGDLKATDPVVAQARNINKKGGVSLGSGGTGYLAVKGDKLVNVQARQIGADDGILGRAARGLGLTREKDKALEAQRQNLSRANREKYLKAQELTDKNVTGYQAIGAVRKGEKTGLNIRSSYEYDRFNTILEYLVTEGYDAYDLVLEYLLSQGHTETIEEAHYVMMEMDEEMIGSIVDEYKNDLLSEEITEWVNELVKDGYDLSEYTWDDLAEYYVNEAKVDTVVDKTLEDAGVSDSIRMSVKKASRANRKTSNNRMTRTQSRLANKLSNIAGRRQDYEGEISGTNRGPESPTDR